MLFVGLLMSYLLKTSFDRAPGKSFDIPTRQSMG